MRLIAISGKRGAGKDTLADWLVREGKGFFGVPYVAKMSLANPIKSDLIRHFDCDRDVLYGTNAQKELVEWRTRRTYRELMVEVGRVYGLLEPTHFARLLLNRAREDNHPFVVVNDLRMRCEAEYFRAHCDCKLVRLTRAENPEDASKVENSLDGYDGFDLVIDNRNQFITYPQNELKKALRQWLWLKGG